MRAIRKAWAFLKRDYLIAVSYKVSFALQLASVAVAVPICYFIGEGVSLGETGRFEEYGGSYFAFLLIGLGLLGYLSISLRTFSQSIRESQMMGTLEIVLLSPTSVAQLLINSSLWIYLFVTVRFALFLLLGAQFGMDLADGNALSALVVLVFAIPGFAAFGIASAALIVVIKRGESVNVALAGGSMVFGGVLFPVSVLPEWLQPVSNLLPITHALKAMRLALFQGHTIVDLLPELGALALFAFVLFPASLYLFWLAVRWTKVSGTLAHY